MHFYITVLLGFRSTVSLLFYRQSSPSSQSSSLSLYNIFFLLDQSKITSELWHSGSNARMSIAGYLPKKNEKHKAANSTYKSKDKQNSRPKLYNKYDCTMDQELKLIQRASNVTRAAGGRCCRCCICSSERRADVMATILTTNKKIDSVHRCVFS